MEIFGIYFSYELLATLLLLFIDVVVFFLNVFRKKVKVVDTLKELILEHLPTCIILAEKIGSTGQIKKNDAIGLMNEYLLKCGIDSKTISLHQDFIGKQIESILCTPQKKGVELGYEKKKS